MRKGQQLKRMVRAAVGSLALVGTLVLSGCGDADVAATVDGRTITESQVADLVRDINATVGAQQPISPPAALGVLIQASVINDYASAHGLPQSDSAARAQIPLANPSQAMVDYQRAASAYGEFTSVDQLAYSAALKKLHVVTNPKYGAFDPAVQGVMSEGTPDWLEYAATK
jgi:hypothetical protein